MTGIDNRQSTIANPRACLVFLGCPKNQVDSEHVLGSLTEAGYTLTTEPRSADLIVITTCAFLQSAVHESESAIEEALSLKQGSPSKKVVAAGCLVERYGASLKKKFPAVDLWVPLADMPRIGQLTAIRPSPVAPRSGESAICNLKSEICNGLAPSSPAPRPTPRVLSTPGHFAYLKIADGCDNRCSYCMIPDIRGPFRSRPLRDIIAEARDLARTGVKELILVAQDTTLYGTDIPERGTGTSHKDTKTRRRSAQVPQLSSAPVQESARCLGGSIPVNADSNGGNLLARLLKELGEIDGIHWLRLMYTHPAHITEDVVDQFASNPKLCRYIDLPVQHVADHLLGKMNRHYTRQDIELQLESLREIPDMHIRTTIIVGLPGETERDFDELLAFVRAAKFDRLSCYAYSPEPGTKAARLPGRVSPAVKKERVRRLMLAQAAISRANLKQLVGRKLTVLVDTLTQDPEFHHQDTKTPSGYCRRTGKVAAAENWELETGNWRAIARTEWDAPEIDGVVKLTGRSVRPGSFVRAQVTGSSTHDLTARAL
jgi:ribosomal protein S12 methylthiotransferase